MLALICALPGQARWNNYPSIGPGRVQFSEHVHIAILAGQVR
jgi:hypothetical protein